MPPEPSNQLTIESTALVDLLTHAASAARLIGDSIAVAADPIADHVDVTGHVLSEPHEIATVAERVAWRARVAFRNEERAV